MPQALIRTEFGELRIEFQDTEDLKRVLDDLDIQVPILKERLSRIVSQGSRETKPGFESLYRFTASGGLELLVYPKSLLDIVLLTLYAYHPDLVNPSDIENLTGIDGVRNKVLGQTNNKDWFRKDGDRYGLTLDGIKRVIEQVAPANRPVWEEMS